MHYIVEDPWPLGLALGGFAVLCLLALWLTGRGRFLIWAGVAGGLIAVLIGVDALWVTVDERIEAVVLDLARAAGRGNSEAVLDLLTDDVILSQGSVPVIEPAPDSDTPIDGQLARGKAAREAIAATLQDTSFDFIHVGNLQPHAEPERRVGVADFRIYTSGSIPRHIQLQLRDRRPGLRLVARLPRGRAGHLASLADHRRPAPLRRPTAAGPAESVGASWIAQL